MAMAVREVSMSIPLRIALFSLTMAILFVLGFWVSLRHMEVAPYHVAIWFPMAMLIAGILGSDAFWWPLFLLQYPAYVLFFGLQLRRFGTRRSILSIVFIHFLMMVIVVVCLQFLHARRT